MAVVPHGRGRAGLNIACVVLLAAGIGLQFTIARQASGPAPSPLGALARELPSSVEGWYGLEEPLGPTEASRAATADLLRYDDYVFRRYLRPGREFSVYIAHWKTRTMPTQIVAEHSPDRCWTENGWVCQQRESLQQRQMGDRRLPPAEWRKFTPPRPGGPAQHVLFWLMVDGKPYDYRQHANLSEHAVAWWRGALADFVGQGRAEKLFVRITSTERFEQIWDDPGFQQILNKVADLSFWRGPED